jgi:DNA-binding transcriptional LysR family regulator
MQLGSTDAVKQWVKAGLGVSVVLASTVKEEVSAGSLVAIPLEGEGLQKALYVVWRDSLSSSHPARKFGYWLSTPLAESGLGSRSGFCTTTA